jgi:geranylgeranyl reductase family protein
VIRADALVVGGGPAGSTCARILRRAGWNVVVADRARFPRDKVCAGWLTPRVFDLLDLDPAEYRAAGLTLQEITAFRTGVLGRTLIETRYPRVVSYAIRRCEFDAFLLRRAGARVLDGTPVVSLRRDRQTWIVNGEIETPVVVGAGGHFCPVARHARGESEPSQPVVAKEAEFPLEAGEATSIPDAPELFFCRDLEGYGWCVRKGNYLNVGIGRRAARHFGDHVEDFVAYLETKHRLVRPSDVKWRGHAYLACGAGLRPLVADGMLLVGDAAGLAYPESGEGICPAIESGRMAAETLVAARGQFDAGRLEPYADEMRARHPPVRPTAPALRPIVNALGRRLLGSPAFTRRVVLDRWFLRTG